MPAKKAARFNERKTSIIHAASVLLNQHGAQGMRRADVADALGIDTSSIAYYFKRRDDLVAACLERTIDWIDDAAEAASQSNGPRARTEQYLFATLDLLAGQRLGKTVPLPILSDLASLSEPLRGVLAKRLFTAIDRVVDFRPDTQDSEGRIWKGVTGNFLLNITFWLPAWDGRFRIEDYPRINARLSSFLATGLLVDKQPANPELISLEPDSEETARSEFLKAATRQINKYGYKGARVDRIAADLGVSTGSFYHHLKTKDELVLASFERSFEILENAFAAASSEATAGAKLSRICRLIAHHQLTAIVPLLLNTSYQALPQDLRIQTLQRADMMAHHLAGLIADGMADGSVRATDPVMAGHCLFGALNDLSAVRRRLEPGDTPLALDHFMQILETGLYSEADLSNC